MGDRRAIKGMSVCHWSRSPIDLQKVTDNDSIFEHWFSCTIRNIFAVNHTAPIPIKLINTEKD